MAKNVFKRIVFLAVLAFFSTVPYSSDSASGLAERLKGRILLQVQQEGEAWYVDPDSRSRIYLSHPREALKIMKEYGLGVSHEDILYFQENGFPTRLAGRILLDVDDQGKAYYIYPVTMEGHYLGRPADAFRVMRQLGLGITEESLSSIPIRIKESEQKKKIYTWTYKNREYSIELGLSPSVYDHYKNKSKVLIYESGEEPHDWHERYFELYLDTENAGGVFDELAGKIKSEGERQGLDKDEIAELALSFVQDIPYDEQLASEMISGADDIYMKYPYEVLYEDKGACGGKSFLAVLLFNRLGYGTSLFEFEEDDHLAAGIKCSSQYSTYGSGYCYAETTLSGYPLGITPEDSPSGAESVDDPLIQENDPGYVQELSTLGKATLRQQRQGDTYTAIEENIQQLKAIKVLKQKISDQKILLKEKKGKLELLQEEIDKIEEDLQAYKEKEEYEKYNDLYPLYNSKMDENKRSIDDYNRLVNDYNSNAKEYNRLLNDLYQY
jgi:hypothetical protein